MISEDKYQNLQKVNVENQYIKFSILPEIGGKMISLVYKETSHEFISLSGRPFRRPIYGDNYGKYDISGFDECFPAIAECFYPEWPWKGNIIPDHGELWTLPWQCNKENDILTLSVNGVRFPYKITKTFSLEDKCVRLAYKLQNLSPFDFKYIWAAHSLFAVTPGTIIFLPGKPNIRTDFSKHERFGKHLYETSWPMAKESNGKTVDLSIVKTQNFDHASKVFTTTLSEGWCGLHDPQTGDFLKFSFPVKEIPFVGMWINEGGWPFDDKPSFNVALEPCTGCPDNLATAIQRGEHGLIKGLQTKSWTLDITIGRSKNPFK